MVSPVVAIIEADLHQPLHQRAVVELIDQYAREPVAGGKGLAPQVRERLIDELRKQSNRLVLLALADETPVGIAVCFQGFSTFHARPLINVHDLAVHPEFRGRGIGRRLLEEVERIARQRGCCRITLEAYAINPRARELYRRLGYQGDDMAGETNYFLMKSL
jgi:ribosomal protein S18 acetylase RimI-like enzyme